MIDAKLVEKADIPNLILALRMMGAHFFDDVYGEDAPELLIAAADAIEERDKMIAELEAQLPKEGEWIPNSPFTGNCSECGGNGNLKDNYCPNCGAFMDGKEQTDETD